MASVRIDKSVLQEYHELEAIRLDHYRIEHAAFLYVIGLKREIRIFWLKKRPPEKPKTPWARIVRFLLGWEKFEGPDKKVDIGLFELGANDKMVAILSNDGVSVTTERYDSLNGLLRNAQGVGFRVVKRAQEELKRRDKDKEKKRELSDSFYIEIEGWPGDLPELHGRN